MEQPELEVRRRLETGKGTARKLRARGYIPAVCYRRGIDPILLSLEKRELERILQSAAGQNILIQLKIKDEAASEDQETVIVKEIQKDRVIVEGEVEDYITGARKLQKTELTLQKKVGDV